MRYRILFLFLLPAALPAQHFQTLFRSGADSVACYRIPALAVAPNGDLLAAADRRRPSCGDLHLNPDIDIVLRTSADNGRTWSEVRAVADFPLGQSASDPSFIVDAETGTIFLFYNFMDLDRAPGEYYFHVIRSTDNGQTWSAPSDITAQIAQPAWRRDFKFITSGGGIQTRSGELLHCLVHLQKGVFVFGSSDHGASWYCLDTPLLPADESKIVELSNGDWMVNARVNKAGFRSVHSSSDRGLSWTTRADSALVDPGCNAGLIQYPVNKNGESILVFSNPNSRDSRTNLSVRISRDGGRSWTPGKTVYAGSAAYSTLAVLQNGSLGLLFEKDDYAEIVFLAFAIEP